MGKRTPCTKQMPLLAPDTLVSILHKGHHVCGFVSAGSWMAKPLSRYVVIALPPGVYFDTFVAFVNALAAGVKSKTVFGEVSTSVQ
jgi:hypothetical protein